MPRALLPFPLQDAALAYFEASNRQAGDPELEQAFRRAVDLGRAAHQKKQLQL